MIFSPYTHFCISGKRVLFIFWSLILLFMAGNAIAQSAEQGQAKGSSLSIKLNNEFSSRKMPDGSDVFICTGGFIASSDSTDVSPGIEFHASNAVVFYSQADVINSIKGGTSGSSIDSPLGIYLEGDVRIVVERVPVGDKTPIKNSVFTAEKVYYDFKSSELYVIDGVLKFDLVKEDVPIYVRAEELRQSNKGNIKAKKIKLSNDSFHQPHLWLGAEELEIRQDVEPDSDGRKVPEIDVNGFTLNAEGIGTLFWWPHGSGKLDDTPSPMKNISAGLDSEFGFSLQTEWDLPWLMGYREPEGSSTRLLLDGYTKRGPAIGIDSEYVDESAFGNFSGFLVHDDGVDELGSLSSRDNVPPDEVFRGRIKWQHRQYLPQNWQASFQLNYLSDKNFLESWYENEFDREPETETSVYLKQQDNNWAFDLLYGFHVNDFEYTYLNEPKVGLYLAGQDLFDHFVYQHDGYYTRFQEIAGDRLAPGYGWNEEPSDFPDYISTERNSFAVSRHELTLPLNIGAFNFVPTAIGTFVYNDYQGDYGVDYEAGEDDRFAQGAFGFRSSMQFWKLDSGVKSDLFDVDGIRHIVRPEVSMFWTDTTLDDFVSQDIYNFALRQRWQTKRGVPGNKRVVDLVTFNAAVTYVTNDVEDSELAGRYIYSRPEYQFSFEPYANYDLYNLDLTKRIQVNQSMHDFATSDWSWSISDSAKYSGGFNYNMTDANLSSLDNAISFEHESLVKYYIGHRYLAYGDALDGESAQYLTAGASYKLNQKYTVSVSTQYDIEDNAGAYTRVIVLRRLPGWTTAFSGGWDSTRDGMSFQIGFWPDSYKEAAIGNRNFTRLAP